MKRLLIILALGLAPTPLVAQQAIAPPPPPRTAASDTATPETVLTDELVQACLEVAAELDPDLARRLREIQTRDVDALREQIRASRRLLELVELRERDPSRYGLEKLKVQNDAAVVRLSSAYQAAVRDRDADRQADVRDELWFSMMVQEGLRHRAREEYLCRLQEQVVAVRTDLADREQSADERAEARIARLLQCGLEPHVQATAILAGVAEPAVERSSASRVRRRSITPEMVDHCLAVAADLDPDSGAQLRELRERDPSGLARRLRQTDGLIQLAELRRREPTLYDRKIREIETNRRVDELSALLCTAHAAGDDTDRLVGELRMALIVQQAFVYTARKDHLQRLEEHVARLEKKLDVDAENVEERVARRIEGLLVPE